MFDELRWLLGLNLVLAIWLGMLADSWKGRRMYVWIGIGLLTSVAGLVLLTFMPKLARAEAPAPPATGTTPRFSRTDSYGH